MNTIRRITQINQKELQSGTAYEDSWHYDYRDTSYIHIGNLHRDLKEEDIVTIFSQYGVPTHIKMLKDAENEAKNRGFCFLKYANFKSCVLAVDNFSGVKVFDRSLKIDHMYFKLRGDENEDDYLIEYSDDDRRQKIDVKEHVDAVGGYKMIRDVVELKEEKEVKRRRQDDEFDDPMSTFKKQAKGEVSDDEFADPMKGFIKQIKGKNSEDEFADPMKDFV